MRKHYIGALIAIMMLVGALVAFYVFSSTMKKKEHLVIDARNRLASFEQNRKIFEKEVIEFDVIKERIAVLEQYTLTSESIPALLSSVETMAKNRSVDLTITVVENNLGREGVAPFLRVDFSAEGSFANIELLVKDLMSQSYQVAFSKFSLFRADGVEETVGATEKKPIVARGTTWQLLAGITIMSF